ncbi:hypothetical protein [Pseudomonas sp. PIC25]|uniref:hypothetical protein n=1 Tax=Pseudomonas sp. PIC25 TaxID=1958773 RepID=UPI00211509E5|nr:hypothetical protein [Pseudomonas sp. PIC25]
MRALFLLLALLPGLPVQAAESNPAKPGASTASPSAVAPQALARFLDLAGVRLLCEQAAPLLQNGFPAEQQARLGEAFAADRLCGDLAARLAPQVNAEQLQEAERLLDSPLARRFTEVEREVGESGAEGLAQYRAQLGDRPPRPERLALIKRLDASARTSELAALLRYEMGKTQALLALWARNQDLDEAALAKQTASQAEKLRESSRQGVESYMLYAYRQQPSGQLAAYAELYERPEVSDLLRACVALLPEVFAARRAALK